MSMLRFQDEDGESVKSLLNEFLAEVSLDLPKGVVVVQSGGSITIQSDKVTKATAFTSCLKLLELSRDDLYVVGLGNAENDHPIFIEADHSICVEELPRPLRGVDIRCNIGVRASHIVLEALSD